MLKSKSWFSWPKSQEVKRKPLRRLARIAIASVAVVFAGLFYFAVREIQAAPVSAWTQSVDAECGIVLTGGSGRIREGVDLLAQKKIQRLIVSGVNPKADWKDIFSQSVLYLDVSEKNVILERRSQSTYGNAQQSLVIAEAIGCKSALLITSSVHLPRALRVFRQEFEGRIPVKGRGIYAPSELTFSQVAFEALKLVFYRLFGLI